ncbi:putative dipeptidase [Gemmatimonas aurantiaca T-27]|uniref:Putative dipeptidase n=1 Tax=Gemmatimonas aurantiaca (strain DSM 14586 / JCM 11422 / NBRC 100505 / T-27) TaxID=379066 RepID=C1A990_GEMAT|nr:putative dipeptidase [Gemmatimonas aurantiaca T-27]
MTRRSLLMQTAVAGLATIAAPMINLGRYQLFGQGTPQYSKRAVDIVQRSLVIDMLSVFTLNFPDQDKWERDPESFTEAEFQTFLDSGINVFHPAVGQGGPNAYDSAIRFFGGWNAFIAGSDTRLMRIDSVGDFGRVKAAKKIAVILGLQNSEHFRRPADVDFFFNLGQRVSQLTYNSRNLIGNGSTERRDEGISDFGVSIIERMNQVGMAIDVSHCGDRTTLDAFELSKKPVLITHSNARVLANGHPRDKADEAILAVKKNGGVMGITGVRMFVRDREPTTIEHALDHFDHVAKLIGPEHLGVGSDIDLHGYDSMPPELNKQLRNSYKGSYGFRERIDIEGLDHPRRMFDLTEGLIRRKYSDANIEGILGGNFRRVLSEIWTT